MSKTSARARAEAAARAFGVAVAVSDLTPPGIRYGYIHPLARALLQHTLPVVTAVEGAAFTPPAVRRTAGTTGLRCGLLADALDIGGVGRVVEMLAEGMQEFGIEPVVVCPVEGTRTARLRSLGIEVIATSNHPSAADALARARLDAIELHSAPADLVAAAVALGVPIVPVLHNTEIHYARPQWRATAALFTCADAVIAVSEIVRRFHIERVPSAAADKIVVVPNGAMTTDEVTDEVRSLARERLSDTIHTPLAGAVVFVCLARYDSQKNIAGTVASFLDAVDLCDAPVHLVVAGDPSDWLEYRRADAIRRTHPHANRVHLLGSSDAATTLAAADAFILDSFFEGWPLAATEAVAVGLPIIVSDTGGAAELVARAVTGSVLIDNASGPAASASDRRARTARRRARRQRNSRAVGTAIQSVSRTVLDHGRGAPPSDDSFGAMVAGHTDVVRGAIERRRGSVAHIQVRPPE